MLTLSSLRIRPLSQRLAELATAGSGSLREQHFAAAVSYANELCVKLPTHRRAWLRNSLMGVAEEFTADLALVPGTALGPLIAQLADIAEYTILSHHSRQVRPPQLAELLKLTEWTRLLLSEERPAMRAWVADLLWEACTDEGLVVYAFTDATPEDARVALALACVCLMATPDPIAVLAGHRELPAGSGDSDDGTERPGDAA